MTRHEAWEELKSREINPSEYELYEAMQKGNKEKIKLLNIAGFDLSQNDIVIFDASEGKFDKVKKAIENGMNVNYENSGGQTVLLGAVISQHKEMLVYLLEKGANPNTGFKSCIQGYVPVLDYAEEKKFYDIVRLLVKYGAEVYMPIEERGVIEYAVRTKDSEIIDFFLDDLNKTEKISLKDHYLSVALYTACKYGNTEFVKRLVEKNIKITDAAIKIAAERGYKDILEILNKSKNVEQD